MLLQMQLLQEECTRFMDYMHLFSFWQQDSYF
jgi:hypothetical protein